jgi:hypothetical protein
MWGYSRKLREVINERQDLSWWSEALVALLVLVASGLAVWLTPSLWGGELKMQLQSLIIPGIGGLIVVVIYEYFRHRFRMWKEAEEIWKEQCEEIDSLKKQLDDTGDPLPDWPLEEAIKYFYENQDDRGDFTEHDIFRALRQLAALGKITMWGVKGSNREQSQMFGVQATDVRIPIPIDFFEEAEGYSTDDRGYCVEKVTLRTSFGWSSDVIYCFVVVNRRQIEYFLVD